MPTIHTKSAWLLTARLKKGASPSKCRQIDGPIRSLDENDILIAGDFNASRFDDKKELFWETMEKSGWDVVGDDDAFYPATRLSGNPLKFCKSAINHIIVTKGKRGLAGEEIFADQATVHSELAEPDTKSFRKHASDHVPVTGNDRVMDDTDQPRKDTRQDMNDFHSLEFASGISV